MRHPPTVPAAMRARPSSICAFVILAVLAGCKNGSGGETAPPALLLLTAGTNVVEPTNQSVPAIDLGALGAGGIESHYWLTTPADTLLVFELVTWRTDTAGTATITVNHVRDGARDIAHEPGSLARAGVIVTGSRLASDGEWTQVSGAGFVRLVLQGRIRENQILAAQTANQDVVTIEIAIGAASAINRPANSEPEVMTSSCASSTP